MKRVSDYDVVIIGGGPAGCAAALRLNQLSDMKVLLIDRTDQFLHRTGESIPPDTRKLLQKLNIWERFKSQQHDPCLGSCSAWGSETLGYNDFIYNPMGHGWHLNRTSFNQMLIETVINNQTTVNQNTRFIRSKKLRKGYSLTLKNSATTYQVNTKWVIDASGIKANFANKLEHPTIHQDHQVSITGFFSQKQSPALNQLTVVESTNYGWWYAARIPDNKTVVALTCDRQFMKRFELKSESNWHRLLTAHSIHIAPQISQQYWIENSLTINRTPSSINSKITGDYWVACGDAASAYDPISAQGIYKALLHGIQGAELINKNKNGNDQAQHHYRQKIRQQFAIYLDQRNHLYQQEKRWPDHPFWHQRQLPIHAVNN